MDFISNISVEIDLQRLMRALGRGDRVARMIDDAKWAIKTVGEQVQPKALVGIFTVDTHTIDTVSVYSENRPEPVVLKVGRRGAKLLAEAREAQISFVTLGDGLQSTADDLRKQGRILKHYILDTAAVLALYHIGQIVNRKAEKRAAQKGWGVSRRISPGDLKGWSIEGQSVLGKILPVECMGIEVKHGGLLIPFKSASGMIGMGPSYPTGRVESICQWCSHQKTCPIKLSELGQ